MVQVTIPLKEIYIPISIAQNKNIPQVEQINNKVVENVCSDKIKRIDTHDLFELIDEEVKAQHINRFISNDSKLVTMRGNAKAPFSIPL